MDIMHQQSLPFVGFNLDSPLGHAALLPARYLQEAKRWPLRIHCVLWSKFILKLELWWSSLVEALSTQPIKPKSLHALPFHAGTSIWQACVSPQGITTQRPYDTVIFHVGILGIQSRIWEKPRNRKERYYLSFRHMWLCPSRLILIRMPELAVKSIRSVSKTQSLIRSMVRCQQEECGEFLAGLQSYVES